MSEYKKFIDDKLMELIEDGSYNKTFNVFIYRENEGFICVFLGILAEKWPDDGVDCHFYVYYIVNERRSASLLIGICTFLG